MNSPAPSRRLPAASTDPTTLSQYSSVSLVIASSSIARASPSDLFVPIRLQEIGREAREGDRPRARSLLEDRVREPDRGRRQDGEARHGRREAPAVPEAPEPVQELGREDVRLSAVELHRAEVRPGVPEPERILGHPPPGHVDRERATEPDHQDGRDDEPDARARRAQRATAPGTWARVSP